MASIKLISLNIERDKHLKLVIPFLIGRNADVVCLQELFETDILEIGNALRMPCIFVPSTLYPSEKGLIAEGTGIFTRLPVKRKEVRQYSGREGELVPFLESSDPKDKQDRQSYSLSLATVEKDGEDFTITTTHFPWTPDGEADDFQREAVHKMLGQVDELGEMVLCGDTNAPRGREIFTTMAAKLKDNVPEKYMSSIDGSIHRAGALPYMVDALFSTPEYAVSDVEMICGVSDHCALVATVLKVK